MIEINNYVREIESKDIKFLAKERDKDCNKGSFGKAGIWGGSINYSGSLKLAAKAAGRCGCGISEVIVRRELVSEIVPGLLEQTMQILDDDNSNILEIVRSLDSVTIGMGLLDNDINREGLRTILNNYQGRVVIDAGGLNILATMDLDILKNSSSKIVINPHLKEFSRLVKLSIEEIKKNSKEIVREFAKKYNIIVLLKGPTTIISDGELVYLVKRGCPGMATAGSGDVLAGILGGFLAYNELNLLTIAGGAYIASIAGELAQEEYTDISMMAGDTIEMIPKAIKKIRKEG